MINGMQMISISVMPFRRTLASPYLNIPVAIRKGMLLQNLAVLNSRCWLMQVDLNNGHRVVVIGGVYSSI